MSKLERLIQEYCQNGVGFRPLSDISKIVRGERITKKDLVKNGEFIVMSGGIQPMGRYTKNNRDGKTITISSYGAAGYIDFVEEPFWANDVCLSIFPNKDIVLNKYLYYALKKQQDYIYSNTTKAIPDHIPTKFLENLLIPVPPLEVQREIVRILDNFTELTSELTSELTAELTARKKQYEYYRADLLCLSTNDTVKIKTIGEISTYRRGSFPQPYGKAEWYDGDGAMPFVQVADIGEDMRLVPDTKRRISKIAQPKSVFAPKGSIIISLQGSIGRIAVTQYDAYIDRTVAIFSNISDELLPRYFVYQLQRVFAEKEKTARGSTIKTITKEEFTSFPISIPSIEEQKKIVNILDRFDVLCNDITTGLPAEIEARQKQYEYYRDKLLTFKEVQ